MKTQEKAYTAPHDVYTGGLLYKPGAVFVTAEPKGKAWQPATEAEMAAATPPKAGDTGDLDALDVAALKEQAKALGLDVCPTSDKADLISVIRGVGRSTR